MGELEETTARLEAASEELADSVKILDDLVDRVEAVEARSVEVNVKLTVEADKIQDEQAIQNGRLDDLEA